MSAHAGRLHAAVAAWIALAIVTPGAIAAGIDAPGVVTGNDLPSAPSMVLDAEAIVNRWQPVAVALGADPRVWREQYETQLRLLSQFWRDQMAAVPVNGNDLRASYAAFTQILRNAHFSTVTNRTLHATPPLKLGSTTNEQVFIPMPPCRIVDTRNVGGPIAAGTQRAFNWVRGTSSFSWSEQGGAPGPGATACPGTVFAYAGGTLPGSFANNSGYPSAAVATVTAVNPTAAGNLVAWGGAGVFPQSSILNFSAGQTLANTTVIPWGGRVAAGVQDFTIRYNGPSGQADVVVDLVGFFVENIATALDCFSTPLPTICAAGFSCTIVVLSCPAGYTATGTYCSSNLATVFVSSIDETQCRFKNAGTVDATTTSIQRCCRVPGQ